MASSARVKAKNKPSLKSQGAGYSTTNRKGETTYYKSSKDAAGYNDTRDGKNVPTTPGTPLSRVNAMGASIPAKMTPETPASIPSPYTLPDIGNVVGQNNTALSSVLGDTGTTYDATKGQFVTSPTTTAPTDNFQSLFQQATQMGNAAFDEMGTGEQRLAQLEKENKLKQKQQAVNETTGQINAVVAQSQAQQLALEGQGRGQTGAFIGGEQARINREAAIAALPLQAKLAAEQGALDLAQSHIDKMFQVQSQDALAKYQYKSKLIESVYSFATGQEQRRLDAIKAKEDRTYDEQKTNLAYQRSLASEAASYGLGGVSASILKLDPKSPTFNQDIAGLQSRVMKPGVASGPVKRDTQFDSSGNLVDMQTGEVIKAGTPANGTGSIDGKPLTQTQQKVQGFADRLLEAERVLKDSNKFASTFARGGILPNFLKTDDRQQFEQARRNFINSVLRTESGAVISEEEFDNAEKQYFPQPGDSDGVVSQKASNRNTVINNFYREANVPRPVGAGDIIESEGKRYKVAGDGVTLIEI